MDRGEKRALAKEARQRAKLGNQPMPAHYASPNIPGLGKFETGFYPCSCLYISHKCRKTLGSQSASKHRQHYYALFSSWNPCLICRGITTNCNYEGVDILLPRDAERIADLNADARQLEV